MQVFIEPFNFSFFSITGQGIDLDYCDIEWFTLEMDRDHSVIFEIPSKCCISDSLGDYDGHSISSEGFLPAAVDIMGRGTVYRPIAASGGVAVSNPDTLALAFMTLTTAIKRRVKKLA